MKFNSRQLHAIKEATAARTARVTEARIRRSRKLAAVLYTLLGATAALVFAYARPDDVRSLGDKIVEKVRPHVTPAAYR